MTPSRTVLLALLVSGCTIGQDKYLRPRDLTPGWLVNGPKLLAMRADPAEVRPGEVATFEALLPDPNEEIALRAWVACPPDASGSLGCALDFAEVDLEQATPEELAELGLIGLEPLFAPSWQAPLDLLDELDEDARREGLNVTVNVLGLPADAISGDQQDFDFAEVETGYKRLVVSEASTPNHNPEITGFFVDGFEVSPDGVVELDPVQTYDLSVLLGPDSVEDYEYLTSSGVLEPRIEEPYARWYATGGSVEEDTTLYPFLEATWVSPKSGEEGEWYAVLRDRRGGIAWSSARWRVR